MSERKKLELDLNKPVSLELLFDEPRIGQSQYGEYYILPPKRSRQIEEGEILESGGYKA